MFNSEKTGKYIMILRKANGYTQRALADKLGISHQAVSQWECGETMPDIAILPELARLLGTTTDSILSASSEGFEGFDEIINKINLVKHKKRNITKDQEVSEYLNSVLKRINEMIADYEEGGS